MNLIDSYIGTVRLPTVFILHACYIQAYLGGKFDSDDRLSAESVAIQP